MSKAWQQFPSTYGYTASHRSHTVEKPGQRISLANDLHIDDDISVAQNGKIYGFRVLLVGNQDDYWVDKVVKEIERIKKIS